MPIPKKPYADDWRAVGLHVHSGTAYPVEYSKHLKLYWWRSLAYDERSANHNGIIGTGNSLQQMIQETNNGR
jgi:hypothetical protein